MVQIIITIVIEPEVLDFKDITTSGKLIFLESSDRESIVPKRKILRIMYIIRHMYTLRIMYIIRHMYMYTISILTSTR